MSLTLETKINQIPSVTKPFLGKLKKLEIETVKDLIFYYPYRFEDYSRIFKIKDLPDEGLATVVGRLELIGNRRSFRKRMIVTEAILTDDTSSVKLVWFNQPWVIKSLKVGMQLKVWGKINGDAFNPFFNSPEYQLSITDNLTPIGLRPVYSLTAGLSLKQLSCLIKKVLNDLKVEDFLPAQLLKKYNLIPLQSALEQIHFPKNSELLEAGRNRLAFDELFLVRLFSLTVRKNLDQAQAEPIVFKEHEIKQLVNSLSFELTADQKKSAWQIIKDLENNQPMNRLLEGDVGSGKTIVAMLTMFNVYLNNKQAVLMAPTEVLANQHYQTFSTLLKKFKIDLLFFTASSCLFNGEKITKKELISLLAEDRPLLIIGTHALIQDKVKFFNLALAVVDEQHRFGVKQRQQLKLNNLSELTPHFLSLTATPIPRSLALAVFGDLDISIIKQLPAERKPIISRVVEEKNRLSAYEFISRQIKAGRQAFVICPLIDTSDKMGFKSVVEEQKKLDQEIFKEFKVSLLHGRLKSVEKTEIMADFQAGKIDVLVSTSVVEVGVDIKNASVMMIEGADRFGLAQLHQFRGRVGRSSHQSYCFLFTDSEELKAVNRLKFLAECSDGFKLAEYDLKSRGAGNVFGEDQSGFLSSFKLANLNDLETIKTAGEAAQEFLNDFKLEEFPQLKNRLNELGQVSHLE